MHIDDDLMKEADAGKLHSELVFLRKAVKIHGVDQSVDRDQKLYHCLPEKGRTFPDLNEKPGASSAFFRIEISRLRKAIRDHMENKDDSRLQAMLPENKPKILFPETLIT